VTARDRDINVLRCPRASWRMVRKSSLKRLFDRKESEQVDVPLSSTALRSSVRYKCQNDNGQDNANSRCSNL
jgi:hypothetical protein